MSARYILLILLVLLSSGCYREASNDTSFQQFDNPTAAQPTDLPLPQTTPTDPLPPLQTTPTDPLPLTRIQPTSTTEQAITTIQPSPYAATPSLLAPVTDTPFAADTPEFITPGGPPGPELIDTPVVTPPGGALTSTPSGLITPTSLLPESEISDECVYTVQLNDNLYRIALTHDVALGDLLAENSLAENSLIHPGDILRLPDCGTDETEPTTSAESTEETVPGESAGGIIHVVQSGETMGAIAERYGVTVNDILEANDLDDPDRLSIGQELVIP